jgi:heat shock protein HslJ
MKHLATTLLVAGLCAALPAACTSEPAWVQAEQKAQTDPASLRGVKWVCVSIDADAMTSAEPITLDFNKDGTVTGFSGINRFSAPYTAGTGSLTFGPIAATRMGGSAESMGQEQRFLQALAKTTQFSLQSGLLRLSDGGKKKLLEFSR